MRVVWCGREALRGIVRKRFFSQTGERNVLMQGNNNNNNLLPEATDQDCTFFVTSADRFSACHFLGQDHAGPSALLHTYVRTSESTYGMLALGKSIAQTMPTPHPTEGLAIRRSMGTNSSSCDD